MKRNTVFIIWLRKVGNGLGLIRYYYISLAELFYGMGQ